MRERDPNANEIFSIIFKLIEMNYLGNAQPINTRIPEENLRHANGNLMLNTWFEETGSFNRIHC